MINLAAHHSTVHFSEIFLLHITLKYDLSIWLWNSIWILQSREESENKNWTDTHFDEAHV